MPDSPRMRAILARPERAEVRHSSSTCNSWCLAINGRVVSILEVKHRPDGLVTGLFGSSPAPSRRRTRHTRAVPDEREGPTPRYRCGPFTASRHALSPGSGARLLSHLVRGDEVLELEVVVRPQVDAALEALADLGDVVLETAQPGDLDVLRHDDPVAGEPRPGAALDLAAADDRAGDVAELAAPEDLADLCGAQLDLLELRLEHALEGLLDLVDRLVDDRVVADLDALALGDLGVLALGPDVEADDDGVGGHREVDVVQRDRTDTAVDDPQVDLVADVDLQQGVLERLDRTRHVTLEDEVEGVDLARSEGLVEVLERDALAALGEARRTRRGLTTLGDLAGRAVVGGHEERVTGAGDRRQAEHHDRTRGSGLLDVVAVLVEHGTHAAVTA